MVHINQQASDSDPLGATGAQPPERPQPSHMPTLPPYSHDLDKIRLLTVTYSPMGREGAQPHTTLIPWTNHYEMALASAKEALQQHFPSGSSTRRRWLTTRVQTSSGVTWAEFKPELFSRVVEHPGVELRLCEDPPPRLDVTVLPIGHGRTTADDESFYLFKIIAVGQSDVGKSMMLQYFTKPEQERREKLENTVGLRTDTADRFLTAHGELVKTVLWDTAGQEKFRGLIKGFYRGAHGVFLVYNIANAESFHKCAEWLTEIRKNVDDHVPIMLVGNQVDREDERVVPSSDAQAFAIQHGLLFDEASGKEGTNVDKAFQKLVHEIFNGLKDRDELYRCKETRRSSRPGGLHGLPQQTWYNRLRAKFCSS